MTLHTGYRTILVWLAVALAIAALFAYFIGAQNPYAAPAAMALSNVFLTLSGVAAIGAVVLTGVADLLGRIKFEIRSEQVNG